jgi:hypothetical protein
MTMTDIAASAAGSGASDGQSNSKSNSNSNSNSNSSMNGNGATKPKAGPWVDEDRSTLEPLPPTTEFDKRPATRDLIALHKEKINKVRQILAAESPELYDPIKHDDLWIMRYILSHKTVPKASAAAKKFLLYRKERGLDDKDIRNDPPGLLCSVEGVRKYYSVNHPDAMIFCQPDQNRGVVLYLTLCGLDQNAMAHISDQDWPFWYFLEWMFQSLDATTRRTGRLTKGIRFVDLKGFSLTQNNRECINRNAKNARECQDHYPQMLASIYVLNVVPVLQACYRLLRPMLPKRFCEKLNIIAPHKKESERMLLLEHLSHEALPTKFGGSCETWPPAYAVTNANASGTAGATHGEDA